MENVSLTRYLQLKQPNTMHKFKATENYYLQGCCNAPDVTTKIIRLFDIKATVLYFCLVTIDKEKTVYDYRFAILYPDNHYEQGNYIYDFETSFDDYITQYVQCQVLNLYTPCIPQLKEAVIFNHI